MALLSLMLKISLEPTMVVAVAALRRRRCVPSLMLQQTIQVFCYGSLWRPVGRRFKFWKQVPSCGQVCFPSAGNRECRVKVLSHAQRPSKATRLALLPAATGDQAHMP
jgi:hypothetical protein